MQILLIYMFFHGNVLYETLLAGWLITLRAGKLQSSLSRWLGLRNCSFFNRACWLKPVTHDRWLGILFPESRAS